VLRDLAFSLLVLRRAFGVLRIFDLTLRCPLGYVGHAVTCFKKLCRKTELFLYLVFLEAYLAYMLK